MKEHKGIKKWFKILLIVIISLCGLGAGSYYLLITRPVQNLVGQRILDRLAQKTNTHISASKLSFAHFKELKIKDLYIEDKKGDTLLYAPVAIAHLDSINKNTRYIKIDDLQLLSASINLKQYAKQDFNFSFLLDSLRNPDVADSLRWNVDISSISLENNHLETISQDRDTLIFRRLNTEVRIAPQSLAINHLSFLLNNGFQLDQLESSVSFDKGTIALPELSVNTPYSSIILRDIVVQNTDTTSSNTALDHLSIALQSNQSFINVKDLDFFIPNTYEIKKDIIIDGKLSGNLTQLRGENLHLEADSLIDFKGDLVLNNLLIPDSFTYSVAIDTLKANIKRTATLYQHITKANLNISSLSKFDEISYKGALNGDAAKVNINGRWTNKYGAVQTSFLLHLPDSSRAFSYSGHIATSHFNLGAVLDQEDLEHLSVDMHIEGGKHQHGMLHYFLADIPTVVFNDYNYHNIELEGIIDSNYVNSIVSIDDPNAHINFSGEINLSKKKPEYLFSFMASRIDLAAINIIPDYDEFIVRFDSHTQLEGNSIDKLNGYADIYELSIETESGNFKTDSLHFTFKPEDAQPSIHLKSDYINAEILGSYNFAELPGFINQSLKGHLRHLPTPFAKPSNETPNDFNFKLQISDLYQLAEAIDFPIVANGTTQVSGNVNSRLNTFNVDATLAYLMSNNQLLDSIEIHIAQDYAGLKTKVDVEQVTFVGNHVIKDFKVNSKLRKDTLGFNVDWKNKDKSITIADFNSNIFILPYGRELMGVLDIQPSTFTLSNATWAMDQSTITAIKDRINIDDFRLHNGGSHLMANGTYSTAADDTLFLDLNVFDLAYLDQFLNIKNTSFSGLMSGEAAFYQQNGSPAMNSEIQIDNTKFNDAEWGHVVMNSAWNNVMNALELEVKSYADTTTQLSIAGHYYPELDSLSTSADFDGFTIEFLQPYLAHTLDSLHGQMHGHLTAQGPLANPALEGAVNVKNGEFRIEYLSTDYSLNDSIHFDDNQFIFKDTKILDQEGNVALAKGIVSHTGYRDMMVDLHLKSDRFLALNNNADENEYFFGDVYYGGLINISTTTTETLISSTAKTMSGSEITVPLSPVSVANKNNFIRYKEVKKVEKIERRKLLTLEKPYVPKRKLVIDMDFEVTEDALVKLEFNSESGDIIKGQGNGNLNVQFEHGQPFQMFGEYEISKGEYLFSLQQLFNKRFDIIAGSTMRWSGRPGNATMDITGKYSTKASLYNLMPDAIGENNKNRRVPVNVKLMLQGLLSQPDISFDIELPSTNEQTQQSVGSIINTEEEISRQVLSLLIMNSFYTPEYYTDASSSGAQTNNQISSVAAVTASEFLSNQLSNWVSQIYSNVDLGFYYVPGQELSDQGISPKEYEMAISSQFFNDRLTVNSNVGYQDYNNIAAGSQNLNNNFIGEIDLELKLNDKLRLKAYSHQNDDILYESSTLKQGVGISYQEDFENISELKERYKRGLKNIFTKKDKRNSEATERKEDEIEEEAE